MDETQRAEREYWQKVARDILYTDDSTTITTREVVNWRTCERLPLLSSHLKFFLLETPRVFGRSGRYLAAGDSPRACVEDLARRIAEDAHNLPIEEHERVAGILEAAQVADDLDGVADAH